LPMAKHLLPTVLVAVTLFAAAPASSEAAPASVKELAIAAQPAPSAKPAPAAEPDKPACVAVSAFARYLYPGYEHVVQLRSTCKRVAKCLVATNVDPKPIPVTLAPSTREEVIVRRASPSREFTAKVSCTLED